MKKNANKHQSQYCLLFILFFSFSLSISAHSSRKVDQQMFPFSLKDVRLLDSPFKHAMDKNEAWLLSFEPDRFMSGFRSEAGLNSKAPKYGGWESQGVAGQTFGHYLSALAKMYVSTENEKLNDRIKYSVNELDSCQQAFGMGGLVAAFPRAKGLFDEISKGDIRTEGFDLNGGWVPLYSMHKLFAGLIDVYKYTQNEQAYKILINLADGVDYMLSHLSDDQIQLILICEHGGINESLAEVYALTGNVKYLKLAQRLNHKAVLDPLTQGQDDLAGKHANTQIPKVIGMMRQYELTGKADYLSAADYFWTEVVHQHSYVIGGNSEAEHFGVPGRTYDRITDKTCENCNTYNMLKLTKHLFELNQSVEKADYYERALYNQILASQNPEDGMVCYMSPLSAGSQRYYSTPFESFWCCVGTGLENHSRYGEFIYYTDSKDQLFVNLFIPSVLSWKEKGISLIQQTNFPESDTISYNISSNKKQNFTLNLRYPEWAKGGFEVYVNGKKHKISQSKQGSYISISRKWKDGDKVTYILPKKITSEAALGDSALRAYLYGPIVLSGLVDNEKGTYPVVVMDDIEDAQTVIVKKEGLLFQMQKSEPMSVDMIPYYKTGTKPMITYFNHYSSDQWQTQGDKILQQQNRDRWIAEQTVSHFKPGEMQPERDHNFEGENLQLGEMHGRKYRKAENGGWFSFDMDVSPNEPLDLVATFWGGLGDIYKFDIEVEGVSVATVIIHWWGDGFKDKTYHIPAEVTQGKSKVNVRFKALNPKSVAGPLFDCKIIKQL